MSTRINFTKATLDKLELPATGQRATYYDEGGRESVRGLQIRITSNGAMTFSVLKRVKGGQPERVTLGRYEGSRDSKGNRGGKSGLSIEQARTLATKAVADFTLGKSPNEANRQKRERSLTFGQALEQYTTRKTRKDGTPLKPRTVQDYKRMVALGKVKKDGTSGPDGELCFLVNKPIRDISAADLRKVFEQSKARKGASTGRRAAYAVTVLRAVLAWKNIIIPNDPFGKDTKGEHHIELPAYRGKPKPIRKVYLGAWWNAACKAGSAQVGGSKLAGDYYRFRLLTGTRGVEVLGDNYGNEPIRVRDVNVLGACIVLKNTKNRGSHTLLLSRQAMQIVKGNMEGKSPDELLFPVGDPRKTLKAINKATGLGELDVQGHDLRDTFASVAARLVNVYVLKRLVNHKVQRNDVTGQAYVEVEEEELLEAWQRVADYIEAEAAKAERVVLDEEVP